jgi:uncharacterized coiled-coil protein SlyX
MPDVDAMLRRVVQLEELFSHHQHDVQQLNQVILELHSELDALKTNYTNQQSQLEAIQESRSQTLSEDLADEKPPHY